MIYIHYSDEVNKRFIAYFLKMAVPFGDGLQNYRSTFLVQWHFIPKIGISSQIIRERILYINVHIMRLYGTLVNGSSS